MTKPFLALTLLCLAALTAHAEVINIDNARLARLAASGVPVIDIRTAGEWKETGVVEGSHLITLYDENGRSDTPLWLEKVKALTPPDRPVIVLCRSGKRSGAATLLLSQQAGYQTVYNLSRGLSAWVGEGRSTVSSAR